MLIDEDDDTPISKLLLTQKSKKGKEAAPDDNDSSDDDSVKETIHSPSLSNIPQSPNWRGGVNTNPSLLQVIKLQSFD